MENNPFDIIKVLGDDTLAWVETANELTAARVRVWELLAKSPGEYIVFNQDTKTLVAHFSMHEAPETPEWWRREDAAEELPQPQPVAAAAQAADVSQDDDFDVLDDFAGVLHSILQPAVA